MFVNKVIGRKLRPAYFTRKILNVQVFHCQKPFVCVCPVSRNIPGHWVDMPSGTEKVAAISSELHNFRAKTADVPFVFLIAVVGLED